MKVQILNDKKRLHEIHQLRVLSWENSSGSGVISRDNFPDGWAEDIDNNAVHFVIINDLDEIIASARISLHMDLKELPYPDTFKYFVLPDERPFAFYSRLVVSPPYRNILLVKKFDSARIKFLKDNSVAFALATCRQKRVPSLLRIGFNILGTTFVDYKGNLLIEETAMILLTKNIIA